VTGDQVVSQDHRKRGPTWAPARDVAAGGSPYRPYHCRPALPSPAATCRPTS